MINQEGRQRIIVLNASTGPDETEFDMRGKPTTTRNECGRASAMERKEKQLNEMANLPTKYSQMQMNLKSETMQCK